MDTLGSGNIDISQMSDAEKKDLQQFVVNESQKARIQQCTSLLYLSSSPILLLHCLLVTSMCCLLIRGATAIHSLTDTCFRKCITGKISSGKLDRSEEPCMQNCVDRFMDANLVVIKNLEQMRTHM
jgi:import inner membrane translocase subunit TIM8